MKVETIEHAAILETYAVRLLKTLTFFSDVDLNIIIATEYIEYVGMNLCTEMLKM